MARLALALMLILLMFLASSSHASYSQEGECAIQNASIELSSKTTEYFYGDYINVTAQVNPFPLPKPMQTGITSTVNLYFDDPQGINREAPKLVPNSEGQVYSSYNPSLEVDEDQSIGVWTIRTGTWPGKNCPTDELKVTIYPAQYRKNPVAVVNDFLEKITVTNQVTNSLLSHYVFIQTVDDNFSCRNSNLCGQKVTTLAFQDRYGRTDSNNDLNVFLQISHTNTQVNSLRGIQLGGDSISVAIDSSGKTIPSSMEISIPEGSAVEVRKKIQITIPNATYGDGEVPVPVKAFLDNKIDIVNRETGEHLSHYVFIQTVDDNFSCRNSNLCGQKVTTLAFQDRYGRTDSNNDLNVFLQISHTNTQVNSLRGIQLGGDSIEMAVNGENQGIITKSIEIN